MKKITNVFILVLLLACGQAKQHAEIFAPDGKAIKGYDPVDFFTMGKPVIGSDSLSYSWKGAKWLFSSQENLEIFKNNPEKYAPQYGGFCAYGTANGHKAPTETETWTIVGDKLYFNYNSKVKEMWMKDQKALIEKADKKWPSVKETD
ncbi:MAG TPA: YHS domain-containing (seleno)protein [Chitinophagaceae bacterium]|jgi:YHS domain-containing protein|nr:YHS domain-containing (seleno)protein [Chitinophagaceae bacterium]